MTGPIAQAVARLGAASPLVLLLDIDGTLAPIAARPADARIDLSTLALLRTFADRSDVTLAFVTGRSVDDARGMVTGIPAWIIGNHGAEQAAPGGSAEVHSSIAAHAPSLRRAAIALRDGLAGIPGALAEDKNWSLAAHYRLVAADRVDDVKRIAAVVAADAGLQTRDGKAVVELRAPVAIDKGSAVIDLLEAIGTGSNGGCALYIGDDATDEDAFRRLDALGRGAITVRVGSVDVATDAQMVVPTPDAVREVLAAVLAARGAA